MKTSFIDTRRLSSILIAGVILIPCFVLVSWQFDILILKSIFSFSIFMNPVTAILFIMAGLSLHCLKENKPQRIKNIGKYIAISILLIATLLTINFVVPIHFNIDQLLFTKKIEW